MGKWQADDLSRLIQQVRVDAFAITSLHQFVVNSGKQRVVPSLWADFKLAYEKAGGDKRNLRGRIVGNQFLIARFDLKTEAFDQPVYPGAGGV